MKASDLAKAAQLSEEYESAVNAQKHIIAMTESGADMNGIGAQVMIVKQKGDGFYISLLEAERFVHARIETLKATLTKMGVEL